MEWNLALGDGFPHWLVPAWILSLPQYEASEEVQFPGDDDFSSLMAKEKVTVFLPE